MINNNNNDNNINNNNEFSLFLKSKNDLKTSNDYNNYEKSREQKQIINNNESFSNSNNNMNNKQKIIIGTQLDMEGINELRKKYKELTKDLSDEKIQEILDKNGGIDASILADLILNKIQIVN